MSERRVTVSFSPEGKVRVEGVGFIGPECDEEMDQVLRDLDLKVEDEAFKDEYFVKNSLTNRI